MRTTNESWRQVSDYKGFYSISSCGRVRRELKKSNTSKGKILKLNKDKDGYLFVTLCRNNMKKSRKIASMVAKEFIGDRPEGLVINHIDFDKRNNAPENLEYITQKQNFNHSLNAGRITHENARKGIDHQCAKLSEPAVRAIRGLYKTGKYTHRGLAETYCMSHSSIRGIINRITWKHI